MERKKRVIYKCIFCGKSSRDNKMRTNDSFIDFIFIPPLDNSFHPVCEHCKVNELERMKNKYPYLWND